MINSITIKNVTSYDNTIGATINDLKKINFFFGNNGSGKSTIAKYLYDVSLGGTSELNFDSCSQVGYDDENHQILVFNDRFVERNFISRDTQVGIFSLNQKNEEIDILIKEKQNHLEKINKKIEKLRNRKSSINANKEKKLDDLKKNCFQERKTSLQSFPKIKDNFPYKLTENNFEAIEKVLNIQPLEHITFNKLLENYKKYYDNELAKIETSIFIELFNTFIGSEEKLNEILQKVIIGNTDVDIAKMIDDLHIKKWVEDGIEYLDTKKNLQLCPFCQKETVDIELVKKFEQYFDESYKKDIETIAELKTDYTQKYNIFISNLQDVVNEYNIDNIVSDFIASTKELFDKNIKIIEEKIASSNEKKEIITIGSSNETIKKINKAIEKNNNDFANLDIHKKTFFANIWTYLASEFKNDIDSIYAKESKFINLFEIIENKISTLQVELADTKKEIEELREQTISTKEAVDNINVILKNSGFEGFQIEEKELDENNISEYFLKRDSGQEENVFKSLSEGEKNFIAFLYFYQLCLGVSDLEASEKKKILVIDDPVSSLDSQVLFIVNSLIQHLIARKGNNPKRLKKEFKDLLLEQVFILTHNIYFHKEVSFDNKRTCTDNKFFTIKKINSKSNIETNEKPIVNDYFLLWDTLNKIQNNVSATPTDKTHNISITNLMRRILESYVNFTGLGGSVWNAIKDTDPEDPINIICSSLISELQDGSHKISPLDDIYFTRVVNEEPQKLFDVFEIIFRDIGEEHYKIMMGLEEDD